MKIFINSRFLGPRCARSHAFRSHLILTKSPRVRLIRAYTFSPKFLLPRISLVVVEQGFNRVITIIYFVISMTQHDEEEHVSSSLPFHHEKAHNGSHGTRSFLPLPPNFPRSSPPLNSRPPEHDDFFLLEILRGSGPPRFALEAEMFG